MAMSSAEQTCPGCGRPVAEHGAAIRGPDMPAQLRPCGTTVSPDVVADATAEYHDIEYATHQDLTALHGRETNGRLVVEQDGEIVLVTDTALDREACR